MAVSALLFVGVFAVAIVYLYMIPQTDKPPRHIRAPQDPVRERPVDSGGMKIEHQDRGIYDRANGSEQQQRAGLGSSPEKPLGLLPSGEIDLDQVKAQNTERDEVKKGQAIAPVTLPVRETPLVTGQTDRQTVADDQPMTPPASSEQQTPAVKKQPLQKPSAVNTAKNTDQNSGVYRVQLGAYGSQTSAEAAWKRVLAANESLVGALTPQYELISASNRRLYRLRLGNIDTRGRADALCLALRDRKQDCIVVKP